MGIIYHVDLRDNTVMVNERQTYLLRRVWDQKYFYSTSLIKIEAEMLFRTVWSKTTTYTIGQQLQNSNAVSLWKHLPHRIRLNFKSTAWGTFPSPELFSLPALNRCVCDFKLNTKSLVSSSNFKHYNAFNVTVVLLYLLSYYHMPQAKD